MKLSWRWFILLSCFCACLGERTYILGYPGPSIGDTYENAWEGYNMGAFRGAAYFYFSSSLDNPIDVEIVPFRMDSTWLCNTPNIIDYIDGIFWGDVPEIATHPNASIWVDKVVEFFLAGGDIYLAQDFDAEDLIGAALGIPSNISLSVCGGACSGGHIANPTSPIFQGGPFGDAESLFFNIEGRGASLVSGSNGTVDADWTTNPVGLTGPLILRWERDQYTFGAGRMIIIGDSDMINTQCTRALIPGPVNENGRFALNMISWLVGGEPVISSSSSDVPPKASAELPSSAITIQVDASDPLAGGLQLFPKTLGSDEVSAATSVQLVITELVEINTGGSIVASASVPLFSSDRFSVSTDNSVNNRSTVTLETDLVIDRESIGSTFAHLLVQFIVFGAPDTLTFAGIQFPVNPSTLKFTIEISQWPFQSVSNKLEMTLEIQGTIPFLPTSLTLSPDTPVQDTSTYSFASESVQGSLMLVDVCTKDNNPNNPVPILHEATLNSHLHLRLTVFFPHFQSVLIFDPNLQILPLGDNGEDSTSEEDTSEEKEGGDGDVTTWIFVSLFVAFVVLAIVLGTGLVVMFLSYRLRMKRLSQLSKSNTQMVSF